VLNFISTRAVTVVENLVLSKDTEFLEVVGACKTGMLKPWVLWRSSLNLMRPFIGLKLHTVYSVYVH
jgi:hypothetical protein